MTYLPISGDVLGSRLLVRGNNGGVYAVLLVLMAVTSPDTLPGGFAISPNLTEVQSVLPLFENHAWWCFAGGLSMRKGSQQFFAP